MFFVVLLTDDTAYNAAVRANPAIGREVDAHWHATVVPWLRDRPGFQGIVAGVDHATERVVANVTFATAEQAAAFAAAYDARFRSYYEARAVRVEPTHIYEVIFQR